MIECIIPHCKFPIQQSNLGNKNGKWCVLPPNQSWAQWISRSSALCPWIQALREVRVKSGKLALHFRSGDACCRWQTQSDRQADIMMWTTRPNKDGERKDVAVGRRHCSYHLEHEDSKRMWTTQRCHAECLSFTMRYGNASTAARWDLSPH